MIDQLKMARASSEFYIEEAKRLNELFDNAVGRRKNAIGKKIKELKLRIQKELELIEKLEKNS